MSYKLSKFNIFFEEKINEEVCHFIYNTKNLSFAKITEDLYCDIKNNKYGNSRYLQDMIENGFVVKEQINETEDLQIRSNIARFGSDVLGLTIAPTMDCNLRCVYCFEQKNSSMMTYETAEKLVKFVMSKIEEQHIAELNVTWYGGEPLLNKELIYYLSEKFIAICREYKIKYSASMISNGIYLSENVANKLRSIAKVDSVQITIDGLENTHNGRRISVDKSNGFQNIIKNIIDTWNIIPISIRVNVDKKNSSEIKDLMDYIFKEKKLIDKVKIKFARVKGNYDYVYTPEEFSELEVEFWKYMYMNGYSSIEQYVPFGLEEACTSVGINYYVVDSDGELYTCWNNIGIKSLSIGNIYDGEEYNTNYSKWLMYKHAEQCNECIYLPLCQGGCPHSVIFENKCCCSSEVLNLVKFLKMYVKFEYEEKHEN